jgi:hypothetical protein
MSIVKDKPGATPAKKSPTRLTPKQLRRLADKLVATTDPVEAARLKKELERGFYGDPAHA